MALEAIQHIRPMRGGAQSHLVRCNDGNFYVVKFRNNPQHSRVLVNELLAARLCTILGLPVPPGVVVEVSEALIRSSPDLCIQLHEGSRPCEPGLHFGSRYAIDPLEGRIFDHLPPQQLRRLRNLRDFAGMLVFDRWTGNGDTRQAVFWRKGRDRVYSASFIDHGYCFGDPEWNFAESSSGGLFRPYEVYDQVHGWETFEPWLSRVEHLDAGIISGAFDGVPSEWCGGKQEALEQLPAKLLGRRAMVRALIGELRDSGRVFRRWGPSRHVCAAISLSSAA